MQEKRLTEHWKLITSRLEITGETLSSEGAIAYEGVPAVIPGTVVGDLSRNGIVPDPYFDTNIELIPGYKYARRGVYANLPKPPFSPFRQPWWYRTEFDIGEKLEGLRYWIRFDGINDSANVWLNGKRAGSSQTLKGAYTRNEIDVTQRVRSGRNILAIQIFSPEIDDFSIPFMDWNPVAPDDCMGLWQPVFLVVSGKIRLTHTFIDSRLKDRYTKAELFIETEVENTTSEPLEGILQGFFAPLSEKERLVHFTKTVRLEPDEKRIVSFSPEDAPGLRLSDPMLWWPYQWGEPNLYSLTLRCDINGTLSDEETVRFGVREVISSVRPDGVRQMRVNGKDLLVRGGAWTPDILLRQSGEQDEIDIQMAKNLSFNALRMEGKLANDNFWDICDREGMMVLAGWDCCGFWEKWADWKPGDLQIACRSLESQIYRLRNHPSLLLWFYGSDYPPIRKVEKAYLEILSRLAPSWVTVSSAAKKEAALTGLSGIKMTGPYGYVPPSYWYDTEVEGRAEGFNAETGPDVCIPTIETIRQMFKPENCFVGSHAWDLHAGLNDFNNTRVVDQAIATRYGKPGTLEDYVKTAQVLGYECWRAMFEAYLRNWPQATGVIGWMMNSAWPSVIWQLYDVYNRQNGAFWGSKEGCRPIHIFYAYDTNAVYVSNTTLREKRRLSFQIRAFTQDLKLVYSKEDALQPLERYELQMVATLPEILQKENALWLSLKLYEKGVLIDENTYWLSFPADTFKPFEQKEWYHRIVETPSDMSWLRSLSFITLESSIRVKRESGEIKTVLKNPTPTPAFFLELKAKNQNGETLSPVYWDDNATTLFPGEEREYHAVIDKNILKKLKIRIHIDGWNTDTYVEET
jgi:exo-1,4-beta-D-glucosaminidase